MDYSHYQRFSIEKEGHLAIVRLNRAEKRNAIDHQFHVEFQTLFVDLADDADVFAILLTGAGDTFSVGGDVKGMKDRPAGDVVAEPDAVLEPSGARRILYNLLDCDKPIVCAINGNAIGLAATIALYNNFVVDGIDSDFGKPKPLYKIEKPPFYAAWTPIGMLDSFGGLRINGRSQVVDRWGEVIPGLYAGGEASGGGQQHGLGRASVHGYVAGTNAAREG